MKNPNSLIVFQFFLKFKIDGTPSAVKRKENNMFKCANGHGVAEKVYPVRVITKIRPVEYKIIPLDYRHPSKFVIQEVGLPVKIANFDG